MKVVNQPIEVIARHNVDGEITPIKFRTVDLNTFIIVQVIARSENKFAGELQLIFDCELVNNKICQIRYNTSNAKWLLFKI